MEFRKSGAESLFSLGAVEYSHHFPEKCMHLRNQVLFGTDFVNLGEPFGTPFPSIPRYQRIKLVLLVGQVSFHKDVRPLKAAGRAHS
jgi:hypothetical protein